jgi:hypothetical protein
VGVETGCRLGSQEVGVQVLAGARFFLTTSSTLVLVPTQLPIQRGWGGGGGGANSLAKVASV